MICKKQRIQEIREKLHIIRKVINLKIMNVYIPTNLKHTSLSLKSTIHQICEMNIHSVSLYISSLQISSWNLKMNYNLKKLVKSLELVICWVKSWNKELS